MASKAAMLARVPLFSQCTPRELAHIARLGSSLRVPAGHAVIEEGGPGDAFYVIEKGNAEVSIGGEKIGSLGAGDFLGELALLDDLPRTATVTSTEPTTLFMIESRDFAKFLDESAKVVIKMLATLTERIRAAQKAPTY